jgi:hypothetical protein
LGKLDLQACLRDWPRFHWNQGELAEPQR